MTEIDWSKAPEGATHYDTLFGFFCNANGYWDDYGWVEDDDQNEWGADRYIERPHWTGEGLPPAGTTCEAWHNGSAQGVVEVRYAGDYMVLWNVELKHEQCSVAENYSFRPIRTPEQIAAEEREKAIREITDIGIRATTRWAEAIYDAGYRKAEGGDA